MGTDKRRLIHHRGTENTEKAVDHLFDRINRMDGISLYEGQVRSRTHRAATNGTDKRAYLCHVLLPSASQCSRIVRSATQTS
jgi:hypothetical protein